MTEPRSTSSGLGPYTPKRLGHGVNIHRQDFGLVDGLGFRV